MIEETKNYEIFKFYPGNRPIDQSNLDNLILSISTKNLLPERPIVINESFYVLDGQHRLEAAKRLNLPVSFVKKEGGNFKDIILLNSNQKNWKLDDYLRLFADGEKMPEYILLKDFMNRHHLKLKESLILAIGPFKEMNDGEKFKNGEFKFSDNLDYADILADKVKWVINLISSHNIKPLHRFKNTAFIKPLVIFITNHQLNWEMLQQRMEGNWFKIGTRPSTNLYLEMFCDIYNIRNQNKIFFESMDKG